MAKQSKYAEWSKSKIVEEFGDDEEGSDETVLRLLRIAAGRLAALGKHGRKAQRAKDGDKSVRFEERHNPWAKSMIIKAGAVKTPKKAGKKATKKVPAKKMSAPGAVPAKLVGP